MVPFLLGRAEVLWMNDQNNSDAKKITSLYLEALSILINTLGTENGKYMEVLKEYAEYQIGIKKLKSADSLLNIAETYWKKRLGDENQKILEIYKLKGGIAYENGDFQKAGSLYESVKNIAVSVYGKNSSFYISSRAGQAKVAYMLKKPAEALNIMEEILPQYMKFVSANFSYMTFREKSKYWNSIRDEFEFYEFLVLNNKDVRNEYSAKVYEYVVATKGILLSNNIKIRQNILSGGDSLLINAYNEWIELKEYYASLSSLPKTELEAQGIDLKLVEAEVEKKEKYLSNRSQIFKAEDDISKARYKEVQAALSPNEYAVELVRYRNFNKYFTDTFNYAALIVSKAYPSPLVVLFGNGNLMETKHYVYARSCAKFKVKDERSYDIFWAPVQNIIPDGSTVYLSSEGVFNRINIEMIRDKNNKYILDRIQLVQVTNTRELLRESQNSEKVKNKAAQTEVVLCGSPDFYLENNPQYKKTVVDLPGATKEIEDLDKLLKAENTKVTRVMDDSLTEEWVKQLNSPRIFHIATHGYYSERKNNQDENNAMLNSGLLLTGAGDILEMDIHVNSRDGILTAYEAMNMKFDNTDLVVLSACETGLGDVQVGEGVYGLQRSFLIAGSGAIILSLYKVNDEVTQKLMMEFYSNWAEGMGIRKSFSLAKENIRKEYPEAPIYWGAFILIEGYPKQKSNGGS